MDLSGNKIKALRRIEILDFLFSIRSDNKLITLEIVIWET